MDEKHLPSRGDVAHDVSPPGYVGPPLEPLSDDPAWRALQAHLRRREPVRIAEQRRMATRIRRVDRVLHGQPDAVREAFRGRGYNEIVRDTRFQALVAQASRPPLTVRPRRSSTPRTRRSGSSSRTSGTDPGDDGDGNPPRLAVLLGRPLANFVALNADVSGSEQLAKFIAQPARVQTAAWAGLRDAIEHRRASAGVIA